MTGPHCDPAAAFPAPRWSTSFHLVGPLRYRPAPSLGRTCGKGLFPCDCDPGLTTRDLRPAVERVAAWAGAVADRVANGAELRAERAGLRRSEATVARTTAEAGPRLADTGAAGATLGPKVDGPWPKDDDGKSGVSVARDATGVRQPGNGGGSAEGRRADGGIVGNPSPEGAGPDEKPQPMPTRYRAGRSPREDFGPLLCPPAGHVGMDRADRGIGGSDGGNGLEDRLQEDFPRVAVIGLDCVHPAERRTGLARRLPPQDEDQADDHARQGRQWLKDEGGVVLAAVLRAGDWPCRPGRHAAADELSGDRDRHLHRREAPESWAPGWCIGRDAVESAGKTVVGPRLKRAGMRGGEAGAPAVCRLRVLDRSETGQWDAFWRRDFSCN